MHREEISASRMIDKVLIVIPCLNERRHIEKLIADIQRDTAEIDHLIVVADGGSTDGTQAILAAITERDAGVKVIFNPKRIQSAGVNLAVRGFGEGRHWLVRIDAHAQYPANYICTLIEEAHRTVAASVVVAMTSRGTEGFQAAIAAIQNSALGAGGAPHRRGGKAEFVDHGHHALFDLNAFVALGGYDENASHNEDAEFDLRLARAGGKIWLTRAVEVIYFPRSNVPALYRQYVCYGRGRAATLVRHRKMPKLRQMLPAGVAPAVTLAAFVPWLPIAAAPALVWTMLSMLAGAAIGRRLGLRGMAYAGIGAVTIHLAWSIGFWWELLLRLRRDRDEAFNAIATAGDAR
ncbi:MAG TPA: glycosyltransferase family 2 protein [Stellaceae bacterium]|jgi:succinoglycan biosynthesis protein ExoA|nr:glycosyltransferase family 2 protein [Stellaceae bacterium]